MLTVIFTYLYPLLTIPCIIGYLPQIKEFIIAREVPKGFAVTGWFVWLGENIISLGYGAVVLQDAMFCFMTSLDLVLLSATIILALYTKHWKFNVFYRTDFVRATLC